MKNVINKNKMFKKLKSNTSQQQILIENKSVYDMVNAIEKHNDKEICKTIKASPFFFNIFYLKTKYFFKKITKQIIITIL